MAKNIKETKQEKTGKFMGTCNIEQPRRAKDQKSIAQKHDTANVEKKKANVRRGAVKHHYFILGLTLAAVDSQAALNNE